jgi:hypothetical protein
MSEEDIIIPEESRSGPPDEDDFEETLAILVKMAKAEGREFLAYLLRMALMEARNHPSALSH